MTVPALWTKHRPLAHAIANDYWIRGLDPEDVRQEAVIALWQASRSHNPELGPFKPWARRVIRARLLDLVRHAIRRPEHVALTDDIAAVEPDRQLRDLIDLLPTLTQLERDAIRAKLNGTYSAHNRRQENALTSARRKWKATA